MKREEDLRDLGLSDDQVLEMLDTVQEEWFEVWPENWETWKVFCAMRTQWRRIPLMTRAVFEGMDYVAMEFVMKMLKVRNQAEVFNLVRAMESAALEVLNNNE